MGAREILDDAGYDFNNHGIMPGSLEYQQSIIDSAEIMGKYVTVSCEFDPEGFLFEARKLYDAGYFPDSERYIGALLLCMTLTIRGMNVIKWIGMADPTTQHLAIQMESAYGARSND